MKDAGTAARTCVRDGWDSDEVAMSVDSFAGAGRLQAEEVRTRERSIERESRTLFALQARRGAVRRVSPA